MPGYHIKALYKRRGSNIDNRWLVYITDIWQHREPGMWGWKCKSWFKLLSEGLTAVVCPTPAGRIAGSGIK